MDSKNRGTKSNQENFLDDARKILSVFTHDEDSIKSLSQKMQILSENNLSEINMRLLRTKKRMQLLETLAELELGVELLRKNNDLLIDYEPNSFESPPDFHFKIDDLTFCIEIKRPGKLEADNRQDQIFKEIKQKARQIRIAKTFSCFLSSEFELKYINDLMQFIKNKAYQNDGEYSFNINGKKFAKVKFFQKLNSKKKCLDLCFSGDLSVMDITNLNKSQLKQTLKNAVKKFESFVEKQQVNLIVMDVASGGGADIDICDAIYGTEYEHFYFSENEWKQKWGRDKDGLLSIDDFSKRVSGVIVRTRKDKFGIICDNYINVLCVNEKFSEETQAAAKKILSIDKVFRNNMRPIKDFFDIKIN